MWETQRSTSGFVYKIFNGFKFLFVIRLFFRFNWMNPWLANLRRCKSKSDGKKVSHFFVFKRNFFWRTALFHSQRLKCQLFVSRLDTVHLLGISTPSKVSETLFPSRIPWNDIFSFMISPSHLIFYSFRVTAEGIFQAFFTAIRSSFEKAYILLSLLNHKIVFSGECTPWEGKRKRSGSRENKYTTQLNIYRLKRLHRWEASWHVCLPASSDVRHKPSHVVNTYHLFLSFRLNH